MANEAIPNVGVRDGDTGIDFGHHSSSRLKFKVFLRFRRRSHTYMYRFNYMHENSVNYDRSSKGSAEEENTRHSPQIKQTCWIYNIVTQSLRLSSVTTIIFRPLKSRVISETVWTQILFGIEEINKACDVHPGTPRRDFGLSFECHFLNRHIDYRAWPLGSTGSLRCIPVPLTSGLSKA
ncbi:hypothetical protein Anapl_06816 [Anas platyrhynchos]|uniref:Uncharacterized protein n=1 Tax=Anas platyrhynchos TaxID=8839 RepID=R0KB75_ANAPL|nr:hypothetical protein Anapl_06816 [Anas platyrhynchos]